MYSLRVSGKLSYLVLADMFESRDLLVVSPAPKIEMIAVKLLHILPFLFQNVRHKRKKSDLFHNEAD
jgi:hypothetical protein